MHIITLTMGIILNFLLFSAIGFWPVFLLSPSKNRLMASIAIAPAMGFAITSLITTYLILLDYPVQVWVHVFGRISIFISLAIFLYLFFNKQLTLDKMTLSGSDAFWLISGFAITALIIILPMIMGGINFTVLRGNGGDSFNYMTIAGYLDRESYSWRNTATLAEMLNRDRSYPLAKILLNSRWTTSAMLAFTSDVASLPIYKFEYPYTLLFFIMSFGPSYLFGRCLRLSQIFAFLTSLVISVGFWAQMVLDTRAFSQISSIPLILAIGYFYIEIVSSENTQLHKSIPIGLLGASLLFSYVEIVPLCILSGVFFLLFTRMRKESLINIYKMLGTALLVIVLAGIPMYSLLSTFFVNQINFASSILNDWDKYYFSWLYSKPIIGFWGLMPFNCSTCIPDRLGTGKTWEIILLILGSILFLIVIFAVFQALTRRISNVSIGFTIAFVCASLVEFFFLYSTKQFWAAGKALAFGYPFFILLIASIGLGTNRFSFPPIAYRVLQATVILWVMFQIFLGLARNYVAITGVEYTNYIVNHGNYRKYDYDLSPITAVLDKKHGDTIWIAIPDKWLSEYVNLAFGADHQVKDVFGIYDRKGILVGNQKLRSTPKYLLVNRNILEYNKSWDDNFKIVAETPDLVLLEAIQPAFTLLLITNPNGIENWNGETGFWLGGGQTILNIISSDDGQVVFTGDFIPGPSIPDQASRKLEILDNRTGDIQTFVIAKGKWEFHFPVHRGNSKIVMTVLDRSTIPVLPNGDQRTLLLGMTNVKIQFIK